MTIIWVISCLKISFWVQKNGSYSGFHCKTRIKRPDPLPAAAKPPLSTCADTLQDIANALLYFEGGSLAKELKRAGLDMTPSAFIQRRHQLHSGGFQDILAAFGAQDTEYETFQGYRVCAVDGSSVNIAN